MESSRYTDVTLEVFETLWGQSYRHMGVVLQADLYRTDQYARRVIALEARVRLVKWAYKEPKKVAYQKKAEVDTAYVRLIERFLTEGNYPAIATHDPTMIDRARWLTAQH